MITNEIATNAIAILSMLLLFSIALFLYAISQPKHHDKKIKGRGLTKEEIDYFFDSVDPINEALSQEHFN